MKKLLTFFLALTMLFSVTLCEVAFASDTPGPADPPEESAAGETGPSDETAEAPIEAGEEDTGEPEISGEPVETEPGEEEPPEAEEPGAEAPDEEPPEAEEPAQPDESVPEAEAAGEALAGGTAEILAGGITGGKTQQEAIPISFGVDILIDFDYAYEAGSNKEDVRWFKVTTPGYGAQYEVIFKNLSVPGTVRASIQDMTSSSYGFTRNLSAARNGQDSRTVRWLRGSTYYVKISGTAGGQCGLRMNIQKDKEGSTTYSPFDITLDKTYTKTFAEAKETHYFRFDATKAGRYVIEITKTDKPGGIYFGSSTYTGYEKATRKLLLEKGEYMFGVSTEFAGKYKVKAYYDPLLKPKIKVEQRLANNNASSSNLTVYGSGGTESAADYSNNGAMSVCVDFDRTDGATSNAEVYRSTSQNGTFKYVGDVSNTQFAEGYHDTDVKVGKTYYYKIRAYDRRISNLKLSERAYSSFSSVVSVTIKKPYLYLEGKASGSKVVIAVGERRSLDAEKLPKPTFSNPFTAFTWGFGSSYYGAALKWSSSNPSVASVDNSGRVTGHRTGMVSITVKCDGYTKATCKVTVGRPVQSLKSKFAKYTLKPGRKKTLKVTFSPSNATMKTLKWTSSDRRIATVDKNGKVTAVRRGKATITATATDGSGKTAKCVVTVGAPVTKLTVNHTKYTIKKGKTKTLKVAFTPTSASNKKLTWKSSNTKVATVDKNGKIKAISKGKATITATATDGSGKKAVCKVTVGTPVSKLKAGTAKLTLKQGRSKTLKAKVSPASASNKTLKWVSSSKKVAKVDKNGKVTAVAKGTATITAKATDGSGKKVKYKVTVK